MAYLGDLYEDQTVIHYFTTNDGSGGRVTLAALETADYEVYKDGSTTGSTAGVTFSLDFDTKTGVHKVEIDMSADAFYTAGSEYALVLYPDTEQIDSQDVASVLCSWSCENRFSDRPRRNVARSNIVFYMADATDGVSAEAGVTVTAEVSKDGGSFATATNAVVEIANGFYKIALTATEMDADVVLLRFTGAGCAPTSIAFDTIGA